MDLRSTAPTAPPRNTTGMDEVEELLAEVDEPPDERQAQFALHLAQNSHVFGKANPQMYERRESLLTQQLLSETEQTDEERVSGPPRALSTQSTRSAQSAASTAELTSDDGRSVASPAISPPFPPALLTTGLSSINKLPDLPSEEPKIVDAEDRPASKHTQASSEQSIESNLGRKRCISFACGKTDPQSQTSQSKESQPSATAPASESTESASPPKRKCALKFVCPTRSTSESKPLNRPATPDRRSTTPPMQERRPSASVLTQTIKAHRGSDSTVRHASPKASRKGPAIVTTAATPTTPVPSKQRKFSNDSEDAGEATRFHEFASSDDEPEEWCQESTAYRSRLTITDTLKKENIIRKACEEVEEEAIQEEEEAQLDDEDEEDADGDEVVEDDEAGVDGNEDYESDDAGFRTDDEGGFAESDSDGEDSDADWWTPGGLSTAATSVEHIERLMSQIPADDAADGSSLGSGASESVERSMPPRNLPKHRSEAVPIGNDPDVSDLPDSTDFVCGTLDEDRPMEQAFLNSMKQREAAKHKLRPQDIDPSFPTSDPEMDEEDDEDLEDPEESGDDDLLHGKLDELDGDLTARRRASPRPRTKSSQRSRSPAPAKTHTLGRSPAPPVRRNTRSPPPPTQTRRRSPAPAKMHATARSPPPPVRRKTLSPPPRKLFGHSPKRNRSPAPNKHYASPPNTRRVSPVGGVSHALAVPRGLGIRPGHLTHTASLPRGGPNVLSRLNSFNLADNETSEAQDANGNDLPKRGAIDIVKGLEKKRQRRKEKLQQKAAAKAAMKGDKAYKVKPGRGAERMREVGLELQKYRGKGEHIISM